MLRYESLRPISLDWNGLQNQFQQQKWGTIISYIEILPSQ